MSRNTIFISHAGTDRERAQGLAKDLMYEGFNVWVDIFEIEPSENWLNDIKEGLDAASVVLVVWTTAAEQSRWVAREIARADQETIPIITLQFDDTKPNMALQTTQPIDFRGSYLEAMGRLISKLNLLEQDMQSRSTLRTAPWQRVPSPTRRNRFLDENNYFLNRSGFAQNGWTRLLISSDDQIDQNMNPSIISLVTIPTEPHSIFLDHDNLDEYLGEPYRPETGHRRIATDAPDYRRFPVHVGSGKRTSQMDHVRYDGVRGDIDKLRRFLRITLDGAIEFADSYHFVVRSRETQVYSLIGILGAAWQMAYFAIELYSQVYQYSGDFQLLINMSGTGNAMIAGFAGGWPSVLRAPFTDDWDTRRCVDANLQFIYQIDPLHFGKLEEASADMIDDASKRIQRAFNMSPHPRHKSRSDDSFDWKQYWKIWQE